MKLCFNSFGNSFIHIFVAKSLIYGQGNLFFRSSKNNAVSSIKQGFLIISNAVCILYLAISSESHCISIRSIFSFSISKSCNNDFASFNLFIFHVTNISLVIYFFYINSYIF